LTKKNKTYKSQTLKNTRLVNEKPPSNFPGLQPTNTKSGLFIRHVFQTTSWNLTCHVVMTAFCLACLFSCKLSERHLENWNGN